MGRHGGQSFDLYLHHNIRATQRLFEAAKELGGPRIVYASSSSVYGDTDQLPARETNRTRPRSPYGVTKLACEHLADLYLANFGVDAIGLRFFTVFGPRQRPDMAFTRFARAVVLGEPITVFGDGEQSRDFTYVSDAVEATYRAVTHGRGGAVYNVGGGERASVNQVIAMLEELSGGPIEVVRKERQAGDARHTGADTSRAEADLGWRPTVGLREGLARQLEWARVAFAAAAR